MSTTERQAERAPVPLSYSKVEIWYVVALLAAANACSYLDRMALPVLMPLVKTDLHLADWQLGLLVGPAFALFYAVCGIPIARWADRGVRRDIIAVALVVWSGMTMLSGAAGSFFQLLLARIGVGAGEAGCLPPAQSLLCDYAPVERRAGILGVHSSGISVGTLAGMALAGWLGEIVGWRWTMVIFGVPGIVLAITVRLTLREPKRGALEGNAPLEPVSLAETLRFLRRSRSYCLIILYLILYGFSLYGLNQWLPSFYMRVHGLALGAAGVAVGVIAGIGGFAGLLLGGWLSDRLGRRDLARPFVWGAAAVAIAFPLTLAAILVNSTNLSLALIFVSSVLMGTPGAAYTAALYSVAPPTMRATAGALGIFFTSALGLGLGPFAVGIASDVFSAAWGPVGLRYALLFPIALVPIMPFVLLAASRSLSNDLSARAPAPPSAFS